LEEFQQLLLSTAKANRQGMESLTNACWDSLRSIGAHVGYGDDVLSAGHPVWTLSTSMGSAGVGFSDQQKDREGPLEAPFSGFAPCTAVFCDRVETEEEFVLMVMKHLEEFPVPKIRTLSRFLSGGLAASCGVRSLEEATWCQYHDFEMYVRSLEAEDKEWLQHEFGCTCRREMSTA